MSILKLFGLSDEERRSLQTNVRAGRCAEGQLEELAAIRPDDEVWVVGVSAAQTFTDEVFRQAPDIARTLVNEGTATRDDTRAEDAATTVAQDELQRLPRAVLWVPEGKTPLSLDDWWEGFHAQLREDRPVDCSFLEKVAQCPQVLDWGERIEDIPAKWFDQLGESPQVLDIDVLPFDEEAKRHLTACQVCLEEVYDRLQHRAEMRWEMFCPSVDEVSDWLESEGENAGLEKHIRKCRLCQESAKRQAWLWQGAGLASADRVRSKLTAVGLVSPDVPWLAIGLEWQKGVAQAQTHAVAAWAALVAFLLCRQGRMHLESGVRREGQGEATVSLDQISASLREGRAVVLSSEGDERRWLHLIADKDGQGVLLRAGKSMAGRFDTFRVEFRRGDHVVVTVPGTREGARLTLEHFQTAQEQQADRLAIIG
jgi:hypothetical protein